MTETEVKERIFRDFLGWMSHQTVGLNDDGSTDYYKHDVENYCRQVRRLVVLPQTGVTD